MHKIYS